MAWPISGIFSPLANWARQIKVPSARSGSEFIPYDGMIFRISPIKMMLA
jgi:hypothetical protein